MKKTAKILTLFITAIMAISLFVITATAEGFSDAKKISDGDTVSGKMSDYGYKYYKISFKSSGTLTVDFTTKIRATYWYLYDTNGKEVPLDDFNIISGKDHGEKKGDISIRVVEDSNTNKASGKLSYKVKKGTYYIAVKNDNPYGGDSYKLTATFKADGAKELSYLGITIKKGDKIQLEAIESDSNKTTWSSSKKSVATVSSSGLVTAKGKGTTIITCKRDNVSIKLKITVK